MTCLPSGLSYKGELLLAFEFAVFSGRFKLFVSSGDDRFMTSSQGRDSGVVPSPGRVRIVATRLAQCPLEYLDRRGTRMFSSGWARRGVGAQVGRQSLANEF